MYRISIDTPRWREGQTDAYLWGRGAPCLTGIAQIPGVRQNGIGPIDSKTLVRYWAAVSGLTPATYVAQDKSPSLTWPQIPRRT